MERIIKSRYISWLFFIVIAATVFNLFYKPTFKASMDRKNRLALDAPTVCSLHGINCNDPKCDCESLCGEGFVRYQVMDEENVYVLDRLLPPGTYCLPRGVGECDQATSVQFYSLAGWSCIPHNASWISKHVPCFSSDAEDNTLNRLFDNKDKKYVKKVRDSYERFGDRLRYECECGSKDVFGNRMVSVIPFTCSSDYCLSDISNPLPFMGWNGTRCECGPYAHQDQAPTSRCVELKEELSDNLFRGRVRCKTLWEQGEVYCPQRTMAYSFPMVPTSQTKEYLDKILKDN